jgi:magnesium transporter
MPTSETNEHLDLADIRDMWQVLSEEEQIEAFELLDRDSAQEFFLTLSKKERAVLILQIPEKERLLWMRILPPDDAVDVIQESPEYLRATLLALLDEKTRLEVSALLSYKDDVAGGLMNPRFARIRPDLTIDEAIHYLRLQAKENLEGIYYLFVLDNQDHLLGVVSFHDLFRAPSEKKVNEIMKTDLITVTENQDQESVSRIFSQYKFLALPVVDQENRLKGIITADDILSTVQAEATEDIQKNGRYGSVGSALF